MAKHDSADFDGKAGWVAAAAHPYRAAFRDEEPEAELDCKEARRALACALLGLFCFGVVLGPLALSLGQKARLRIAWEPGLGGERAASAAILLGKIALIAHLALTVPGLVWLLFAFRPGYQCF